MLRNVTRPIMLMIAAALIAPLAGCATGKNKGDTKYVARDVDTLYNAAKERLDQHQYKLAAQLFDEVERRVSPHPALRGNVETEIASEDSGAGCGCAYPLDVSDDDVSRSNAILERLRQTAWRTPVVR